MAANGGALGVHPRPGIELPAPCIGHVLGKGVGSCPNDGSITLTTIIEDENGGPMPVMVTVCPDHVRGARLYLAKQGRGDDIDAYATLTLAENFEVFEKAGLSPWVLTRTG